MSFKYLCIMLKRLVHIYAFIVISTVAGYGQVGGDNTYEFLNLTNSGYVAALGGNNVSIYNDNINMSYHNPALLSYSVKNNLALDYVSYLAGINYGLAIYSWSPTINEHFAGGVTYYNYGSFTEADEIGNITGTFTASEFSFPMIFSLDIDSSWTIGTTLKPILSHLEKYTSFGVALDLGMAYHSADGLFSAGITAKNIGLQITKYASEKRMGLPFEIMAGISTKLEHAPLSFSLTLRHLEKYNLIHDYNGDNDNHYLMNSKFTENLMRHIILGVELTPHKNFYLCGGYNYQRRQELKMENKPGSVGFSWGFGINTSFLDVEFARATYSLAGASTHISMIIKLEKIYSRNN